MAAMKNKRIITTNLLKMILKSICLLIIFQFICCSYVYKRTVMHAFLGDTAFKEPNKQAMVFCMGGFHNKFYYIRIKPFPTSQLDTTNLFKFIGDHKKNGFFYGELSHGDFGTPYGKLPIRIVDTSIIAIDSVSFGKHVGNCSTIYFSLKKHGKTEMIVKLRRFQKDTILLNINEGGLAVENSKRKCNGKTKWLGIFPIKN